MYLSEFCDVKYEEKHNVAFVEWKKFCCQDDYRRPLEYALDIGHTFFSGLITGLANGIGAGAMLVGLIYAYSNIKNLREAKERLPNR